MAVLTDPNRVELWSEYMRECSREEDSLALTKADLRAAVNALDDYMNDNAAAINSTIPQPARSALTTAQKARLLARVVLKRYAAGV